MQIKNHQKHIGTIKLYPMMARKIDGWIEQVKHNNECVKITRSQMLECLVGAYSDTLTEQLMNNISDRYADPIKMLELKVKRLKAAKRNGEKISFDQEVSAILSNIKEEEEAVCE